MYDVTALGEALVDFAWQGENEEGYPALSAHPGGAPGNFLAALSAYGRKTAMLAKVGADEFGAMLCRSLKKAGIETGGVVSDPSVFTTLAFVTLDERGERSFSFARKPGADTYLRFEELDLTLIDQCRDFHFGSLSLTDEPARETTHRAVAYAKERGRWISFDPNLRPPLWESLDEARSQILWGLEQADVVKLSGEEGDFLWRCGPEEAAQRLHGLGVKIAFVTLGSEGCLASGNGWMGRVEALRDVKAVDATGAGDIFGGAALSRLLGLDKPLEAITPRELEAAARFATAAAGLSVERFGGMTSVPTLEEVLELYGAGSV